MGAAGGPRPTESMEGGDLGTNHCSHNFGDRLSLDLELLLGQLIIPTPQSWTAAFTVIVIITVTPVVLCL